MNWKPFSETPSNPAGVADEQGRLVAHVFGQSKEERRERSRLIAAATDLLAACTRLSNFVTRHHTLELDTEAALYVVEAKKAIADAESEAQ